MSMRASFVEHFGDEAAVRVEEAALGHLTEGPFPQLQPHADDRWGDDPFKYLFMVCIAWDCFTRWRPWHHIDAEYEELLAWALEFADLHLFNADVPDYMALLAGAYNPWINWQKAGVEEPESTADFRERNLQWAHASEEEYAQLIRDNVDNLKTMAAEGMRLLHEHEEKDAYES